jgi:hypothetical protein
MSFLATTALVNIGSEMLKTIYLDEHTSYPDCIGGEMARASNGIEFVIYRKAFPLGGLS